MLNTTPPDMDFDFGNIEKFTNKAKKQFFGSKNEDKKEKKKKEKKVKEIGEYHELCTFFY